MSLVERPTGRSWHILPDNLRALGEYWTWSLRRCAMHRLPIAADQRPQWCFALPVRAGIYSYAWCPPLTKMGVKVAQAAPGIPPLGTPFHGPPPMHHAQHGPGEAQPAAPVTAEVPHAPVVAAPTPAIQPNVEQQQKLEDMDDMAILKMVVSGVKVRGAW